MLQRYTGKGIKQWLSNGNRGMREPQGSFLKTIFGPQLGGNFKCGDTGENYYTYEGSNRYILKTSIKTDGFSVQCHVLDLKRSKIKTFVKEVDPLLLYKQNSRAKKEKLVALPDNHSFALIIGADFGQTNAGGFVGKDVGSYFYDNDGSSDQEVSLDNASYSLSDNGSSQDNRRIGYEETGSMKNLKIKSSVLAEPTRMYQNYLKLALSHPPYQSLFKNYATTNARRPLRLTRMGAISKHKKVVMTEDELCNNFFGF